MSWLGALAGAAIDRQDGDSGIKGAIIGAVTEKTIRVVAPLAVTLAIGLAVQYGAKRALTAINNRGAANSAKYQTPIG